MSGKDKDKDYIDISKFILDEHPPPYYLVEEWFDIPRILGELEEYRNFEGLRDVFGISFLRKYNIIGYNFAFGPSARVSIKFALETLKETFRDKRQFVVVPAYICHVVPQYIIRGGFKLIISDVDENGFLTAEKVEDIERKFRGKIFAVFSNHLYGIPNPHIKEIREITKKREIFLIEDCADTVGGKIGDIPAGEFGDISVFSFGEGKPLPLYGGALLLIRKEIISQRDFSGRKHELEKKLLTPEREIEEFNHVFNKTKISREKLHKLSLKELIRFPIGFTLFYLRFKMGAIRSQKVYEPQAGDIRAFLGTKLLPTLEEVFEKRKKNFQLGVNIFKELGFRVFPNSYSYSYIKANPLRLGLIVKDRSMLEIDILSKLIMKKGVVVGRFNWGIPVSSFKDIRRSSIIFEKPKNSEFIASHHVNVPIHQNIPINKAEEIYKFIATTLKKK